MIRSLLFLAVFAISFAGLAQEANQQYDSTLAKSLGADDYGMKSYVFVILKTGTYTPASKAESDSLFRGHMNNIQKLAKEGHLVVAGPIGKNEQSYRGIFIFNTSSKEQTLEWLKGDDAIKAKVFDVELYNWYGSAALPAYLPVHSKIEKSQP
jgi:uncharacterized protein YciI